MPAPKGNLNALRNFKKVRRLTLGTLPPSMYRVTQRARQYRRDLEALTADAHGGDVSILNAHLIDQAVANEVHAGVCRWLLRNRIEKLSPTDILACSRDIPRAKADRNRAVAQLGLDKADGDPWEVVTGRVMFDEDGEENPGSASGRVPSLPRNSTPTEPEDTSDSRRGNQKSSGSPQEPTGEPDER